MSVLLTDSEEFLVWTTDEALAVCSRSAGPLFTFLMMLFDERMFLTLTRSSLSVILFMPDGGSRGFIALPLTFGPVVRLELIFEETRCDVVVGGHFSFRRSAAQQYL